MRNGLYGLRPVVLTLLFLALLRDPRAEGLTRVTPADLGRLLGFDRAPEVKTLRRKLGELAGYRRGAALQSALAAAHAAAQPDAIGYLMINGSMRAYSATATCRKPMSPGCTWPPARPPRPGSPTPTGNRPWYHRRAVEQPGRRDRAAAAAAARHGGRHRSATLVFDRGGWSPALLKKIVDAEFDLICWRKGDFDPLVDTDFTEHGFADCDIGVEHAYTFAETTTELDCGKHGGLSLRQIHKRGRDGSRHPLTTCRRDLPAAEIVWRLGGPSRHENYFRYGQTHFAFGALNDYTTNPTTQPGSCPTPPSPTPPPRSPRRTPARRRRTVLADAISAAAGAAGRPDDHGSATVDAAAVAAV